MVAITDNLIGGSLVAGDIVHLDPRCLPELRVITAEEAKAIEDADPGPRRQFIVSWGKSEK